MLSRLALTLAALAMSAGCAAQSGAESDETDDALTGGTRDARWSASGYLVRADSASKVVCGARLIAERVVVTAAHCVADDRVAFAFGTGDVGSGPLLKVVERHAHPDFHPTAQGDFDLTHTLRNFDVAYLVLDRASSVAPATLIDRKPDMGEDVQAIGYQGSARKSTPAVVELNVKLGSDPIFELHPQDSSALCVADGDEGGAVVLRDAGKQVLVGVFAGSVTAGLTDCRRGTQFLDGYESMFGYGDFLRSGVAHTP